MKTISRAVIAASLLALGACGDGTENSQELKPLAENPPMGADDIDALVESERQRLNGAEQGNSQTK